MGLTIRSLRSGSSGNCLLIGAGRTRIFIDCGLPSQRQCRRIISEHLGSPGGPDAVIVSHAHTDHINYSTLRVFEQEAVPLWVHEAVVEQMALKHFKGLPFSGLRCRTYGEKRFSVGDLEVEPIEVRHHPLFPTFGFIIRTRGNGRDLKAVVVTDCMDREGLLDHFVDADLIYIEANHDPELLRLHPNPNSYYHMLNEETGWLLCEMVEAGGPPEAVMLGHLSAERNTPELAVETVRACFRKAGIPVAFDLLVAPRYRPSPVVELAS